MPSPWDELKNQIFLGDDQFVESILRYVDKEKSVSEIPKAQRRKKETSIEDYVAQTATRNEAIIQAYHSGNFTLAEVGDYFCVHYSTVGGIVKRSRE